MQTMKMQVLATVLLTMVLTVTEVQSTAATSVESQAILDQVMQTKIIGGMLKITADEIKALLVEHVRVNHTAFFVRSKQRYLNITSKLDSGFNKQTVGLAINFFQLSVLIVYLVVVSIYAIVKKVQEQNAQQLEEQVEKMFEKRKQMRKQKFSEPKVAEASL